MKTTTLTLTQFFQQFFLPSRPSLTTRTVKLYVHALGKFHKHLKREPTLADLTNSTVGEYLKQLGETQKPAGVDKHRGQLLAIWRLAHRMGIVADEPDIDPIKVTKQFATPLSEGEVNRLRFEIENLNGTTSFLPNADLMRAVFSIQLACGVRIGELLALEWSDLQENRLLFRAEHRKPRATSLLKEVPHHVVESIQRLRRSTAEPKIFPLANASKIQILYDQLFRQAGVDRTKGRSSHVLRITHLALLGQSSPGVEPDPNQQASPQMLLTGFLVNHYARRKTRGKVPSQNQIVRYQHAIALFTKAIDQQAGINDLSEKKLAYFTWTLANEGYSPGTIKDHKNLLLSLWRYAYALGIADTRPGRNRKGGQR